MGQHQMNFEKDFLSSSLPHILMITNHGIHQWQIIPGLPDTGGQNVFVNQFTHQFAQEGFKVTIVNRGGYPHSVSDIYRCGYDYMDENQRILYLEDGYHTFVPKEEMDEHIPDLCEDLEKHFSNEGQEVDLIISHYWDGGKLGLLYNQTRSSPIQHIWIPHSLGALKKRNIDAKQWEPLHIDERIKNEKLVLKGVDAVGSTSARIDQSLRQDYRYDKQTIFIPPCVDPECFYPHAITEDNPIWSFLSQHCGLTKQAIQRSHIITEISRTDRTKRKDVLIKAFAMVKRHFPDAMLIISIEKSSQPLGTELLDLIRKLKIEGSVAVIGSVWDQLPDIYALTKVYCTPSIMEGFGMSAQEAAATAIPIVASNLVPFVTEYLLGENYEEVSLDEGDNLLKVGKGAVVVEADDVDGFAKALMMLLAESELRRQMGESAYQITIPYFTWQNAVRHFLESVNIWRLDEEQRA